MQVLDCFRIVHCFQFFACTWLMFENCLLFTVYLLRDLTSKQPTFACANARKETHVQVHVICLDNNKIYCIFKA